MQDYDIYLFINTCVNYIGYCEPNLELNLWDFGTSTDDCFLGLTLAVKPSAPNLGTIFVLL